MTGRQAGFTYIAVLIAVAIVGTGLAAVGQVWQTLLQRDREKELLYVGNQFRKAIDRYYVGNRRYPLRLEDLVLDDRHPGIKRHVRKIFVDPMTGRAEWGTVKLADGQVVGVYSLSNAKPLKKAGFHAHDTHFEGKEKYSEWRFMTATIRAAQPPTSPAPEKPAPPATGPRGTLQPGAAQPRIMPFSQPRAAGK